MRPVTSLNMKTMMNNIRPFLDAYPQTDAAVFIDPSCVIIGDVVLGADSSVWPMAVIRGDVNYIRVGERSNVQDLAMLHVSHKNAAKPDGSPLIIGDDVTVGHQAMLHGCRIGNRVLVGMKTTILDDAIIEDDVMIGAGSLVPARKRLESGYLYVGSPVKQVRKLTEDEIAFLAYSTKHYVKVATQHQQSSST